MKKDKDKNNKLEKRMNQINAVILTGCIAIVSVGMIFLERPTISETENRTLAKMPEWSFDNYFDGSFTGGISEFYNDTVPMRSTFKKWNTKLTSLFGIESDDTIFHGNVTMVNKEQNTEPAETTQTTAETTTSLDAVAQTEISGAVTEESIQTSITTAETTAETTETETEELENDIDNGKVANGIIIYKNRGIMMYGSYESTLDSYIQTVNSYKADLGENVNVCSMVIPTAAAYYLPEKYSGYSEDQFADMQYMRERFNGVIDIDVSATLENHKEEDIYLRTDHHWAPLGAYYAAEKYASQMSLDFPDLSTYEEVSEDGYIGTIYTFTQEASILDYPETFTYYKPDNEYNTTYYNTYFQEGYDSSLFIEMPLSSLYVTFMGGDNKVTHINTDVKNGRTLCVLKDSFGNAMIPFLTHSFENIYVIDIRYFNLNAVTFMKEHNVTDLLFAVNAFTSATPSMVRHIETLRTQ